MHKLYIYKITNSLEHSINTNKDPLVKMLQHQLDRKLTNTYSYEIFDHNTSITDIYAKILNNIVDNKIYLYIIYDPALVNDDINLHINNLLINLQKLMNLKQYQELQIFSTSIKSTTDIKPWFSNHTITINVESIDNANYIDQIFNTEHHKMPTITNYTSVNTTFKYKDLDILRAAYSMLKQTNLTLTDESTHLGTVIKEDQSPFLRQKTYSIFPTLVWGSDVTHKYDLAKIAQSLALVLKNYADFASRHVILFPINILANKHFCLGYLRFDSSSYNAKIMLIDSLPGNNIIDRLTPLLMQALTENLPKNNANNKLELTAHGTIYPRMQNDFTSCGVIVAQRICEIISSDRMQSGINYTFEEIAYMRYMQLVAINDPLFTAEQFKPHVNLEASMPQITQDIQQTANILQNLIENLENQEKNEFLTIILIYFITESILTLQGIEEGYKDTILNKITQALILLQNLEVKSQELNTLCLKINELLNNNSNDITAIHTEYVDKLKNWLKEKSKANSIYSDFTRRYFKLSSNDDIQWLDNGKDNLIATLGRYFIKEQSSQADCKELEIHLTEEKLNIDELKDIDDLGNLSDSDDISVPEDLDYIDATDQDQKTTATEKLSNSNFEDKYYKSNKFFLDSKCKDLEKKTIASFYKEIQKQAFFFKAINKDKIINIDFAKQLDNYINFFNEKHLEKTLIANIEKASIYDYFINDSILLSLTLKIVNEIYETEQGSMIANICRSTNKTLKEFIKEKKPSQACLQIIVRILNDEFKNAILNTASNAVKELDSLQELLDTKQFKIKSANFTPLDIEKLNDLALAISVFEAKINSLLQNNAINQNNSPSRKRISQANNGDNKKVRFKDDSSSPLTFSTNSTSTNEKHIDGEVQIATDSLREINHHKKLTT